MRNLFAAFTLLLSLLFISGFTAAKDIGSTTMPLPAVSPFRLYVPTDPEAVGEVTPVTDETDTAGMAQRLKDYAHTFLGTRYAWGATGPKSFDCSGFIGHVFRNEGINLPRTSSMQYRVGKRVKKQDWEVGDLLFFSSPRSGKGRVGHVGMVAEVRDDGSISFIHASTTRGVTYQRFPDGGYYSRNYIGCRRILSVQPIS